MKTILDNMCIHFELLVRPAPDFEKKNQIQFKLEMGGKWTNGMNNSHRESSADWGFTHEEANCPDGPRKMNDQEEFQQLIYVPHSV